VASFDHFIPDINPSDFKHLIKSDSTVTPSTLEPPLATEEVINGSTLVQETTLAFDAGNSLPTMD